MHKMHIFENATNLCTNLILRKGNKNNGPKKAKNPAFWRGKKRKKERLEGMVP